MAINTESRRASVLNAGSFFPGRIPYLTEPSGSNLDSKAERGTVLHHYAGIDADAPIVAGLSIPVAMNAYRQRHQSVV